MYLYFILSLKIVIVLVFYDIRNSKFLFLVSVILSDTKGSILLYFTIDGGILKIIRNSSIVFSVRETPRSFTDQEP